MKYVIIINVLAFALFGMDKRFAQKGKWRIPEKLLFIAAIFGGAAGAIFGMYSIHMHNGYTGYTDLDSKPEYLLRYHVSRMQMFLTV